MEFKKEEILAYIKSLDTKGKDFETINNQTINDMKAGKIGSFRKNADVECAVELVKIHEDFYRIAFWNNMITPINEDVNRYYADVIKCILANPNVVNERNDLLQTYDIEEILANFEKYTGKPLDEETAKMLEDCREKTKKYEEKREEARRAERKARLKTNSGLVYSLRREDERRSSSPLYVNRGGALSYGPANSHSRRIK